MPHESTVEHEATEPLPQDLVSSVAMRARSITETIESKAMKRNSAARTESTVPHLRAETPRKLTHHHDEDDSDEDIGLPMKYEDVLNGSAKDN